MYHLIATDLDGTLLLPDDRIGDYSHGVLQRLLEAGKHLVIATGRSQPDVEAILRPYNLQVHLITANGARISSACKTFDTSEHLPAQVARTLLDASRHVPGLVTNLYCQSRWFTNADSQQLEKFKQNPGFAPTVLEIDEFPSKAVEKIFFIHKDRDHEALAVLEEQLKARLGDQVHSTFSSPWCLEMMAASVSKGSALKKLADFLQVPLSQCIAFGDGMNDVEMLSSIGKGLVMGTAHAKVFQALPGHETLGSCSEESVARYLAANLLTA
ncbi:Cof-type HAD-IIB family hydrolase [Pseudomonas sp. MWU13-2105]|uniref:Cof-type HAD-IIB family hydrolase n=1 Tax=Pseudomonas sp. MWU13-2105 TaxID=2935074 RepID=UPI00200CA2D8|nr:Cof-type HAD-IIB family hydrolase [Pseudomonas sp. MWU13-2105]